ncbi:MAG: MFS transporter [Planctomycetota bacterium]|nr:MFS transporter [Planctomycetota bacterium]
MEESRAGSTRPGLSPVLLVLFVDLVGFSIIFPLFPAILDSYRGDSSMEALLGTLRSLSPDIDDARLVTLFGGVLGSLYSILQFLVSPFWGSLSDRIGRRKVLFFTIAGNFLASLLWAFSGTFALLVLSRVLAGIAAGNISAATAAVADLTPGSERARGMGLVGAAFGLGFILGPAIGGALGTIDLTASTDQVSQDLLRTTPFTAAALGVALLNLINLLWIWKKLPETRPEGLAARPIRFQLSLGSRWGKMVLWTQLANLFFLIAFSSMEFTLAFLVRQRFGWGIGDTALMFVAIGIVLATVQGGGSRRFARKLGEHQTALLGLVLVAFGLAGIAISGLDWQLWLSLVPLTVGAAMVMPMLSTIVSLGVGPDEQGEVLGVFRSLGSLARALGPLLGALLYWKYGPSSPYWAATVLLAVPAALLAAGLARKRRIP